VLVPESAADVDTGIDLSAGDEYAIDASGTIWAGVVGTFENGPEGWTNVDHDPKFPLHEGPDAHPFALIGRFDGEPYFYAGRTLKRGLYMGTGARRLRLRTNDDTPGNGSGAFTCRVRVWRRRGASMVAIADVVPNPAGSDVQTETGEHVVLVNNGNAPASVDGWYLTDLAGHRLIISHPEPLPAAGTLCVYTGAGTNTSDRVYCGRRAAVLNNRGDTIVLHSPDDLAVSTYWY
jgi:Lamin Tail Domain